MDTAIRLCHLPAPPSSLWTAAGGREEGVVLFKSQPLSSFGQWITERRGPGSFSPSMGDRGSVWGKERGRRAHLESCACACVSARVSDLGQLGAARWNPCHVCVLKDVVLVPDSAPRSGGSVKSPGLRTASWVGRI